MKLEDLQKYTALIDAGLSLAEIERVHQGKMANPVTAYRECPDCGHMHQDNGEAIAFCQCGYCRHAVITGSAAGEVCEHCDEVNPKIPMLSAKHFKLVKA